jgi:hypothetical protein
VTITLPKGSYAPRFENNMAREHAVPPARSRWQASAALIALGGMLVAAALIWRSSAEAPAGLWQPVPLVVLPGLEGSPTISPDGNLVAFAWSGPGETSGSIPPGLVRGERRHLGKGRGQRNAPAAYRYSPP